MEDKMENSGSMMDDATFEAKWNSVQDDIFKSPCDRFAERDDCDLRADHTASREALAAKDAEIQRLQTERDEWMLECGELRSCGLTPLANENKRLIEALEAVAEETDPECSAYDECKGARFNRCDNGRNAACRAHALALAARSTHTTDEEG